MGVAISDSLTAIEGESSWILENVTLSTAETKSYQVYDKQSWPLEWSIANVWNGLTPDGQIWELSYDKGYIFFSGILKTKGTWS